MNETWPWTADSFNGMPYRKLGRTGLRASNVGLGTWKFGYPDTGDGSRVDEKTAFKILDRAVELGVTFWDTANRYNNASGNSERIIGKWLHDNPVERRNIVIATKIFGGMDGRTPNHSRLSRGNILDSVYACLKRLKADYIDLLYFHSFDDITPAEESLAAIEDLVERDVIRYFGVSNFSVHHLNIYKEIELRTSVRCRVAAVQNQYDIINGEGGENKGILDYAASSELAYIAWSPLARGLLTERYLDIGKIGPGDRLYDEGNHDIYKQDILHNKVAKLEELAREWDMKLNQLVLSYMLSIPGMGPVIPSCTTVEQLESNSKAGKLVLDDEKKEKIMLIIGNQVKLSG